MEFLRGAGELRELLGVDTVNIGIVREELWRLRRKLGQFGTAGHKALMMYLLNLSRTYCTKDIKKFTIILPILLGEITREEVELAPGCRSIGECDTAAPGDWR